MAYNDKIIVNHKRNLPHIQIDDCILFITWRLAFNIPAKIINQLNDKKNIFNDSILTLSEKLKAIRAGEFNFKQMMFFDDLIGTDSSLPDLLTQSGIATILQEVMHFNNMKKYELLCYCIMPNHVHLLIKPLNNSTDERYTVSEIMHSIKSFSTKRINLFMQRTGNLWQKENFDRVVRNEIELHNIIRYILNNPVKAGLCNIHGDWKYSYLSEHIGYINEL